MPNRKDFSEEISFCISVLKDSNSKVRFGYLKERVKEHFFNEGKKPNIAGLHKALVEAGSPVRCVDSSDGRWFYYHVD